MDRIYQALFRAGIGVDFIQSTDDLSSYKAVFAPDLYILPDEVATSLVQYIEQGGILFADSRTGVKDETSLMHPRTPPGLLSVAFGISIEEYESLGHDWAGQNSENVFTYPVMGSGEFSGRYTATQTCEWVKPETAEMLLEYDVWHLQGMAALTRNSYGSGWAYFAGTNFAESEVYDRLIQDILKRARIDQVIHLPLGVEMSLREGDGKRLLFLINHTEENRLVQVPGGGTNLITGAQTDKVNLGRFGFAVVVI
jgi:beta-galactosidase